MGQRDPSTYSFRPGYAEYSPALCATAYRGRASGPARRRDATACRAAYCGAEAESDAEIFGGNYDRKLFAKLRKLRKAIADEENIPPYVVFNDATLIEMVEQTPLTAGEMLSVNGVGTRKLERFGKEFMALIRAHVDGDDE